MKHSRAIRRSAVVLGPMAVMIGISGCSGTSGGNGFEQTVPITSNTRMLQSGDMWTWNITGTETPNGGQAENISGTRTFTVSSVTPNAGGGNTVDITEQLSLNIGGTQHNSTETIVLTQNSAGDIEETSYTENGTTVNITSNSGFKTPGTFTAGETESGNLVLSNGETETVSTDVTGQNSTTTNAMNANWNTWNMTGNTSITSNGQTTTETQDYQWAPALGQYLQETLTETEANGTVVQETITMTNTSIPSSEWGVNPASMRKGSFKSRGTSLKS